MALVAKALRLDITPGAIPKVVNVSEYDQNRQFTVNLIDEGGVFEIPSGTTATVEGTIGNTGFSESATVSGNTITFTLTESMTAKAGDVWCKIKLVKDSKPIQTCAFILRCDRAGVEADTVIGAPGFQEQINEGVAEYFDNDPPFFELPSGGQEGQALISDGEGGAEWGQASVEVDASLSVEGAAADAKAAGDALSDIENMERTAILSGDISGERSKTVSVSLPAGKYIMHVDSITTTDTHDDHQNFINFRNGSTTVYSDFLERATPTTKEITLSSAVDNIIFYGRKGGVGDVGTTFTFYGFSISKSSVLVETVEQIASEVSDAKADIVIVQSDISALEETVDENLFVKSANLYDPSLQTPDTISPHYYVNGVPYSTTQFDNVYNCTALIPIEPNTQYTIAIVPEDNGYSLPWRTAAQGMFFYDSEGNYISNQNLNTFTTPSNAAFMRFNYALVAAHHWNLDFLNSHCMLVKGDTIPTEYESYKNESIKDVVNTKADYPLWYNVSGNALLVGYNYSTDKNIVVKMGTPATDTGNGLFDFLEVGTLPLSVGFEQYESNKTVLFTTGTDSFAPYKVGAVNNADGDASGQNFTGGYHRYNNTAVGSTPTARSTYIHFYADRRQVTSGSGKCYEFCARWCNYVQGYNTEKADGTGREIIRVEHSARFANGKIYVQTIIYPLEDVVMNLFYGFQGMCRSNGYPNVRYIGGENRLEYTGDSNSGSLSTYLLRAHNGNNFMEVEVDPLLDLGKRENAIGTNGIFVSSGKSYFSIINKATQMAEGSAFSLRGSYKFYYG